MQTSSLEAVVRALNENQVQYLIVGGLAVVAHGHVRFTADVDVMLSMDEQNLTRVVKALKTLEYQPRAPVALDEFVDPALRRLWAVEKQMVVFSLFSPAHPTTEVDLFVEPPIDFSTAYANAARLEIAAGVKATFCSLDDLIELKSKSGRPADLQDVEQLRRLRKDEA